MTTPTLTEAPTPEIFGIIEACLYRIQNFTNIHESAKSAAQAVAEVGRRLAAAEAEVARLHRQSARLTEEVHDLLVRLQEAHRDAEVLAAGENDRRMSIEGFTPYPALESVRYSRDDLFAAMQRAARRAGGA